MVSHQSANRAGRRRTKKIASDLSIGPCKLSSTHDLDPILRLPFHNEGGMTPMSCKRKICNRSSRSWPTSRSLNRSGKKSGLPDIRWQWAATPPGSPVGQKKPSRDRSPLQQFVNRIWCLGCFSMGTRSECCLNVPSPGKEPVLAGSGVGE